MEWLIQMGDQSCGWVHCHTSIWTLILQLILVSIGKILDCME